MKIKTLVKCINEFGIRDGCRIFFWYLTKEHARFISSKLKAMDKKIFIKKLKRDVYIRPYTTDLFLLLYFFVWKNDKDGTIEYEIDFSEKLNDVKYIIDAGANIGLFSLIYSNKFPDAKIIAIEPEIDNYKYLIKNTATNKNIHCIKAGLWYKDVALKVYPRDTGEWGFIVKECLYEGENVIQGISIKSIMDRYEITTIDILKMDIEGSEYEIFSQNYNYWLERTKVLIIEIHEMLNEGAEELISTIMNKYGYMYESNGENQVFFNKTI